MEEPSVLDYLKSLFNFRSKDKIKNPFEDIPDEENILPEDFSAQDTIENLYSEADLGLIIPDVETEKIADRSGIKILSVSWRILLSLFLAFIGQILLEPPQPSNGAALIFYGFSLIFFIWSVFADRFEIVSLPLNENRTLSVKTDWLYFGFTLAGMIITFLAFGSHKFNFINLFLWFFTLILGFKAFWLRESDFKPGNLAKKVRGFFKDPVIHFRITPLVDSGIDFCFSGDLF